MPLVKITPITSAPAGMTKDIVLFYNAFVDAKPTGTVDEATTDVRSQLVAKYPTKVVWSVDLMKAFLTNLQKSAPTKSEKLCRMHDINHKIKKYKHAIIGMVSEYSNMQGVIRMSGKAEEDYLLDKNGRTVSAYMKAKRAVDQAKHKYDTAADLMTGLKSEVDILMLEIDLMLGGLYTKMTAAHGAVDAAKMVYLTSLEAAKSFEDNSVIGIVALKDIDDRNDSDSDSECDDVDKDVEAINAEKKRLWDIVVEKNDIVSSKIDALHSVKTAAIVSYTDDVVDAAVDIYNDNPIGLSDDLEILNTNRKQCNEMFNQALKSKLEADNAFDTTFRKKVKLNEKPRKVIKKKHDDSDSDSSDDEVKCHKKKCHDDSDSDEEEVKCHKKKKHHKKKHEDSDSSSSDEEVKCNKKVAPAPIPPKADPQFSDLVLKLILDIIKPK